MNCYFCQTIPEFPHRVVLDEFESRHAAGSRRQQVGDRISLIDGKGTRAVAVVERIDRSAVQVRVETRCLSNRPNPEIILGSALPKGERQKIMLDMMTQLGVSEFVPLNCERSVVRPGNTSARRWLRICMEACKQSANPYLPDIRPATSPPNFVRRYARSGVPVYLAEQSGTPVAPSGRVSAVAICVGPEGGFTADERAQMMGAGAREWSLGPNVLRIETAAVAAVCSLVAQVR